MDCVSECTLAVKHVPLDCLTGIGELLSTLREAELLTSLCHPNIVRCLGVWVTPGGNEHCVRPWANGTEETRLPISTAIAAWEASTGLVGAMPALNILTEYIDGASLDMLIRRNKICPFTEELIGAWLAQIILAIDHMHTHNIVHRDIKPANIFITRSGLIKLGDLGSCKMLKVPDEGLSSYGSPQYLSPEAWQHGTCAKKNDIWAIGCVVYEVLARSPPFTEPNLLIKVLKTDPPELPDNYSASVREIVYCMLQKDPETRPDSTELLETTVVSKLVQRWLALCCTYLGSNTDHSVGRVSRA